MRKLELLILILTTALLSACGSSDDALVGGLGLGPGGQPPADIGSLTLLTSSPQIPSDGAADATISALVRDSNNNVMENVSVVFTADSGSMVVTQPITDQSGLASATLSTAGDRTNRTITVTAISSTIQSTVTVDVVGSALVLNGPTSLPLGDTGNFNVVLTDAGGGGIGGVTVDITSTNGNTISATPLTTDAAGQAAFTVTAANGGADTVTALGAGLIAVNALTVSADAFSFTDPVPNFEIPLLTDQAVTVNWQTNNLPVVGQPVNFSSTRGTVSLPSVNTDGAGDATITVNSTNAGPAVITATNTDGTVAQLVVEFVATVPQTLELQASPFTVAPQEQSTVTAIVRDAAGNLVKNQIVDFTLTDVTGGALSVPQATTDSQGRAQTFYTANVTTSASGGVQIDATVQGTGVTGSVALTVAQRELFISIGTGNEIFEPNSAQYRVEYAVQVTDSQGIGVDGATVQVNVLSDFYMKGHREFPAAGDSWLTVINAVCPDEDINRNGVLDGNEDQNNNNRIEAGNIVTAVSQISGTGTFVTDSTGFGLVDIFYPQEFAYYLDVTLEATTSVQGTEFAEATSFILTGSASDFNSEDVAPPGPVSRFGDSANCGDTF